MACSGVGLSSGSRGTSGRSGSTARARVVSDERVSPGREADPTDAGAGLLRVCELQVSYGGVRALRGVSLAVPDGEIVAVLGSNGAGKSTLLRAISGTLALQRGRIDGGRIELAGRSLTGLDPAEVARAGVVQVPEGRRIFAELTVEENLRAGAFGRARREGRANAAEQVFELFPRLHERRRQQAGLLSGGEQQMLAIGRALMASPRVLLLDEPSLGLAPRLVDKIGETIRRINSEGIAVVLVEQNAAMALQIADRALVFDVGRIALEGTASALADSDEVRERYLGLGGGGPQVGEVEALTPVTGRRQAQALTVSEVTVRFGGLEALSGVSLEVEPGSTHALIGPNGAGKSTLLNVLTGVYSAASGSVRYGDAVLTGLRPARIAALGISRTFQNLALSPTSSVADNLLLGRHRLTKAGFVSAGLRLPSARREEAEQERIVSGIAALLELDRYLDDPLGSLAYGNRKRVELARALCAEPTLLLLDEPVAGMNAEESQRMARTILQVRETLGISVVLVEHDMAFVMGLADRVTVLDFGRRIADGEPDEVQRDPEVLRAYLGFEESQEESQA
jgi:ABC-type branched-subunit amino acid transport system ATPase component